MMKYYVNKELFLLLIKIMIFLPLGIAIGIILIFLIEFSISEIIAGFLSLELLILLIVMLSPLLLCELGFAIFSFPTIGSKIAFEENSVKCSFGLLKRKEIFYDEITTYGTFDMPGTKNICLSRLANSDYLMNNGSLAFKLFKQTKDVIVLEYHDEVMELLKEKCPNITPWEKETE